MANAEDLKSSEENPPEGSSPSSGTRCFHCRNGDLIEITKCGNCQKVVCDACYFRYHENDSCKERQILTFNEAVKIASKILKLEEPKYEEFLSYVIWNFTAWPFEKEKKIISEQIKNYRDGEFNGV